MKKLTMLVIVVLVGFFGSTQVFAEDVAKETSLSDSGSEVVANEAKSSVVIGFSSRNNKKDDVGMSTTPTHSEKQTIGRLPSTGESIGLGLSLIGLLVIIVLFRKEIREIIWRQKN